MKELALCLSSGQTAIAVEDSQVVAGGSRRAVVVAGSWAGASACFHSPCRGERVRKDKVYMLFFFNE